MKFTPTQLWMGVVAVVTGFGLATNWLIEKDKELGEAGARMDSLVTRVTIMEKNQKAMAKYIKIRLKDGRVVQMPPQEGLLTRLRRKFF